MSKPKGQRWLFKSWSEHFIAESLGDGTCVVIQTFPGDDKEIGYIIRTPSWDYNPKWVYLEGQDAPN